MAKNIKHEEILSTKVEEDIVGAFKARWKALDNSASAPKSPGSCFGALIFAELVIGLPLSLLN